MQHVEYKVGDKFKSKNGLIGTVEDFSGVRRLAVRDEFGKITQTINIKKIDLAGFERVE